MSEPAKKRRSPWLFIALVLAIYVLGIGPAYRWGFSADPVASRWTYRTYWPLATLSRYRIPEPSWPRTSIYGHRLCPLNATRTQVCATDGHSAELPFQPSRFVRETRPLGSVRA